MRVRQVDNAFKLLEIFASERRPMTLTELAHVLEMPKSSVFNLLETFIERGLLYEVNPRGGYYPTRRLHEISIAIMTGDSLLQRIRGELEDLATATGETVVLSVREQSDIVYVDVVESTSPIRYFAKIGERRSILTTASGRAILMSYQPDERAKVLKTLKLSQGGGKWGLQEVSSIVEDDVARGWSEDWSETTKDVMGLGTAVLIGERRFGLALAGPIYRMGDNREALASKLIATARSIERVAHNDC